MVDAAAPGDEIWVQDGIYRLLSPLTIDKAVYMYGGFAGNESSLDQRRWWDKETRIDGNERTRCVNLNSDAVLDGFTITGGLGGGIKMIAQGAQVVNSKIINNRASGEHATGGGIYLAAGTVKNCVVSGNTVNGSNVAVGGGIGSLEENKGGRVINCTVVNNSAVSDAGGSSSGGVYGGEVVNSIIWGNLADHHTQVLGATVRYSTIDQDGYDNPDWHNIRQDPLFQADGYHLQQGSPCIDVGDNGAAGLPAKDIDGSPRIIDGDNNGSTIVDMGADEYINPSPDRDGDGIANNEDNCPNKPNGPELGNLLRQFR